MHHHRSGKLKQNNKQHKNVGHVSKRGAIKGNFGKVPEVSTQSKSAKKLSMSAIGKQNRLNHIKQIRQDKRTELLAKRRLGGGATQGPPLVVGFFGLSSSASTKSVQDALISDADRTVVETGHEGIGNPVTALYNKHKTRLTMLNCIRPATSELEENTADKAWLLRSLDVVRCVDVLVLVMDVSNGLEEAVDKYGHEFMSTVKAAGTPAIVGLVQGLENVRNKTKSGVKRANELRKHSMRFYEETFPNDSTKFADAEANGMILRAVTSTIPKQISWRQHRGYVLAQAIEFETTGMRSINPASEESLARAASLKPGQIDETSIQEAALTERASATIAPDTIAPPEAIELTKEFIRNNPSVDSLEVGTIKLAGFLRGSPLSVNQYVNIAGVGIFPISRIEEPTDPFSFSHRSGTNGQSNEIATTVSDPSAKESIKTLASENLTAGEQTWPTMEEEAAAEAHIQQQRRNQDKSGGAELSADYTKAWLVDQEDIEEETQRFGAIIDKQQDQESEDGMSDEDDDASIESDDENTLSNKQKGRQIAPKTERELEADELEFPDEIDTPMDIPARHRFGRYRGLQSFRTSPWDPKESLPRSYARIFQLSNYNLSSKYAQGEVQDAEELLLQLEKQRVQSEQKEKATERRLKRLGNNSSVGRSDFTGASSIATSTAMTDADVQEELKTRAGNDWIATGRFVTLVIDNVPKILIQQRDTRLPLLIGALLRHEHQTSVVHFNVQRINYDIYDEPIRSKDELVIQCGFHRFLAQPIFAENNLKCDKHKYERYLHAGRWTVLSTFGPIMFGSAPVQVFKYTPEGTCVLVATGTTMSADPDRIILKKILLTGHPVRVKRRSAVVKYMFFSPEDIRWFKPVELFTKHGLSGVIRDPVGTHGSMKCSFSGVIKQHDTVCMPLYKRVFPRWSESYRHLVGHELMTQSMGRTIMRDDLQQGKPTHELDAFLAKQATNLETVAEGDSDNEMEEDASM